VRFCTSVDDAHDDLPLPPLFVGWGLCGMLGTAID